MKARIGWKALTASEYVDEGAFFLSTPNIKTSEIDFSNTNFITQSRYDESPELKLEVGDVLIAKDGNTLGITNIVRHLPGAATVNGSIAVVRSKEMEPRFLRYVLASRVTQGVVGAVKAGMGVPHLFQADLRKFAIPRPPWDVQDGVANFLDRETERIDALIDKKRRLIDLLEEKRTATITQAVTKGLEPTAPMKDSGIPWLGTIPARWECSRLKHSMISLIDTEHKTVHFVDEGEYPVIRTSDVRSGRLLLSKAKRTDQPGYREWTRRRRPRPGDVMLAREAPAGEACLVPQAPPVCLGQRMVLITPDPGRLLDKYLLYSIYGAPVQIFIELASQGSTVAHLNMADIPELPIALPVLREQREIVRYLDKQTAAFDRLSMATSSQIALLEEYREALITAAVTGEIDVDDYRTSRSPELEESHAR